MLLRMCIACMEVEATSGLHKTSQASVQFTGYQEGLSLGADWEERKSRSWRASACASCASTISSEVISGDDCAAASLATTADTTSGIAPASRPGIFRSIVLNTCHMRFGAR